MKKYRKEKRTKLLQERNEKKEKRMNERKTNKQRKEKKELHSSPKLHGCICACII